MAGFRTNCLRNCLLRKQSLVCAFSKENALSKQSLVCAFPQLFAIANNTRPRVCENKRSIGKRSSRNDGRGAKPLSKNERLVATIKR